VGIDEYAANFEDKFEDENSIFSIASTVFSIGRKRINKENK